MFKVSDRITFTRGESEPDFGTIEKMEHNWVRIEWDDGGTSWMGLHILRAHGEVVTQVTLTPVNPPG